MKLRKMKDESGSTMLLAIFLIVIVSIMIISFSVQVGNQINSTINADEGIQQKYDAESKIEDSIAKFIEGINVVYMDEICKYTGNMNEDGKKIYEKKSYYKIEYLKPIDNSDNDININIANDIEDIVSDDGVKGDTSDDGITILYKTELVTEDEKSGTIIEDPQMNIEFDSQDLSSGTTFTLTFEESDPIKTSEIDIKVTNISGNKKGQEKCQISYEVKSWRS